MTNWNMNTLKMKALSYCVCVLCISATKKTSTQSVKDIEPLIITVCLYFLFQIRWANLSVCLKTCLIIWLHLPRLTFHCNVYMFIMMSDVARMRCNCNTFIETCKKNNKKDSLVYHKCSALSDNPTPQFVFVSLSERLFFPQTMSSNSRHCLLCEESQLLVSLIQ